jgi:glycosyltransferase involved in cell wall biosynthesis
LCALPLRLQGSKIVLDIHDTMPELYREKFGGRRGAIGARLLGLEERASAYLANRVLAVHEPHRSRLERAGVSPRKIAVVVNVPDHRIFGPSCNGHQPHRPFTVVCHGTIAARLGLDVAIRAMELLRDRCPEVRLVVPGAGDYLAECQRLVTRLDLERQVRFVPAVPLERLPQLLSHAAIGLVPNRASSATHLMLPVKLLEYASIGIPIVAARLRTIEHYFDDRAVRFFEPGDCDGLAVAIEELYRNPSRRVALAAQAYGVMQKINWRQQRANYYAAIDSLLPPDACVRATEVRLNERRESDQSV